MELRLRLKTERLEMFMLSSGKPFQILAAR